MREYDLTDNRKPISDIFAQFIRNAAIIADLEIGMMEAVNDARS